jgi:uncharacterized ferritin-like protein (DUF455 family)
VVRFAPLGLPPAFYTDFARVADDEARHFGWCQQRLGELGHAYGDMPAHDLLWQGCQASAGDLNARCGGAGWQARGGSAGGTGWPAAARAGGPACAWVVKGGA